ncbi:hypothetical protein [Cellulophaga sp. HaHa_2_1]|uniref:hypothetical protein n=1 Tax=Cellulophaga sp. HaHa_2_1 TaxID=2749994 RepID=UPI001C4EBF16|nr:hypothetical protein [Cellulophaga sp. HaHa_2_1]QXP53587.1 hypothetical protein H0I24_06555 [Cellulophaga sp. HaHa_2_1]
MKNSLILLIILLSISCKKKEKGKQANEPTVVVKLLNPSIVNEPVKVIAVLVYPEFAEKESQIYVALEMNGDEPLKKDLSNEFDIDIEIFANLEIDSLNQKFVQSKDKRHSAVFGKTFTKSGINTFRGYVWDFYGFELMDSIIPSQSRKYYFEFDVNTKGVK